jgi:hypothetical protein
VTENNAAWEETDRRITGLLFIRSACKRDFSLKYEMLATLSLRTINSRLLQLDQEGEAADYRAEIRHNMVILKSGIGLGIIEGARPNQ